MSLTENQIVSAPDERKPTRRGKGREGGTGNSSEPSNMRQPNTRGSCTHTQPPRLNTMTPHTPRTQRAARARTRHADAAHSQPGHIVKIMVHGPGWRNQIHPPHASVAALRLRQLDALSPTRAIRGGALVTPPRRVTRAPVPSCAPARLCWLVVSAVRAG